MNRHNSDGAALTRLLSLLLLAAMPATEAPLVGRPREHFYGAIGEQVRVELKASPTELRAEDALVLTLAVHGAVNPEAIERPNLKQLPEFSGRFHIDDLPDEGPVGSVRTFRYRLRPKSERVRDIPPLLFHYFNPRLNYFATTAPREAINLKVQPREPLSPAAGPLQEPEFVFEFPDDVSELLRQPTTEDNRLALLVAATLAPPSCFLLWYVYWRWHYPSAARLARLRRTRAVREALDALDSLAQAPDLADRVVTVVVGYLRGRIGLPAHAITPSEIKTELKARGMPANVVDAAEEFFRACDAVRFGPPATQSISLASAARGLIAAVEGAT